MSSEHTATWPDRQAKVNNRARAALVRRWGLEVHGTDHNFPLLGSTEADASAAVAWARNKTDDEILRWRNFGPRTLADIRAMTGEPTIHGCSSGTCTGACCAVFPLSTGYRMFNPQMGAVISDEEAKIAHMIVPLTVEEADARMARLGYEPVPLHDGQALFTCQHWDEETRLCGAYDERPDMCRKYPYGSACERGCGYELSPEDKVALYGETEEAEASPFEWSESDRAWAPRDTAEWVWDGAMIRRRDDEHRAVAAPAPSRHPDTDRDA